jgi:hypothetical protein
VPLQLAAKCAFQVEVEIIIMMEHAAPRTIKALLARQRLLTQRAVTSVRQFL